MTKRVQGKRIQVWSSGGGGTICGDCRTYCDGADSTT